MCESHVLACASLARVENKKAKKYVRHNVHTSNLLAWPPKSQ